MPIFPSLGRGDGTKDKEEKQGGKDWMTMKKRSSSNQSSSNSKMNDSSSSIRHQQQQQQLYSPKKRTQSSSLSSPTPQKSPTTTTTMMMSPRTPIASPAGNKMKPGSIRTIGDYNPTFTKMFIPPNKDVAHVLPYGCDDSSAGVAIGGGNDTDMKPQRQRRLGLYRGTWQVPKYSSGFSSSTSLSSDRKTKLSLLSSSGRSLGLGGDNDNQRQKAIAVDEVWIFRDDDEDGIDPRVYENDPPTGRWGYGPSVQLRTITRPSKYTNAPAGSSGGGGDRQSSLSGGTSNAFRTGYKQRVPAGGASTVDPSQMWFFPPNYEEKQPFPDGFQQMGDWIQPVYQRDMSSITLSPGASGFFSLPTEQSPGGTKGKWKVLGIGDDGPVVIRRRKKDQKEMQAAAAAAKTKLTSSDDARDFKRQMITKKASVRKSTVATAGGGRMMNKYSPSSPIKSKPNPEAAVGERQRPTNRVFQIWIKAKGSRQSKPFPLQVQPGFKIGQCRQKIMKMRGIPLENISLSVTDEIGDIQQLDDDTKTLQELGIRNDDTVVLAPITVYIRTTKGKKLKLSNIDPELSIEALKQLVKEKEGTPLSEQGLFYNRQPMQDGDSITKYKVKHKSNIDLKPIAPPSDSPGPTIKKKLSVTPKTTATRLPGSAALTSTTQTTKRVHRVLSKKPTANIPALTPRALSASPSSSPPSSPQKRAVTEITVISPIGKKIPIYLAPDDDIEDLKRKAAKKVGMPLERLALLHDYNCDGDNANTALTEDSYQPASGDVLRVAPVVTVRLPKATSTNDDRSDHSFTHCILPGQTVKDVKALLEVPSGLKIEDQQIFVVNGNNRDDELEDEHVIVSGLELELRTRQRDQEKSELVQSYKNITVKKWDGSILKFEIRPEQSAEDVRNLVATKVGMSVAETRLVNNEEEELDYLTYIPSNDDFFKIGSPRVTVVMPDGSQIELEAEPDTLIEDIKDILEDEISTPKASQRLYLSGRVDRDLDDDTPIDRDMELLLEFDQTKPTNVTVTIFEPTGRKFYVDIDPEESSTAFRAKIAGEMNISEEELRLCKNDDDLDLNFFPENGDILVVKWPRIAVKPPFGKTLYLDKRPGYTAKDITKKITEELGLAEEEVRLRIDGDIIGSDHVPMHGDIIFVDLPAISVELPNGSKIELTATPTTRVADIKIAIQADTGIDAANQHLFFVDGSAEEVTDEKPMTRDTRLRMELKKKPVSITVNNPDETSFLLVLNPDDTPRSLRQKISTKSGVPLSELRLTISGVDVEDDYLPQDGATIDIDPPAVTVTLLDGTSLDLSAPPGITLLDIKETLAEETGVSACEQRILLSDGDGDELEDDMLITNDLDVRLVLREEISFVVVTPDGVSLLTTVEVSDSPEDVRQKIASRVGIPVGQLRLIMNESELDSQFVPSMGDTVHIAPPTINVELPDGKTLELEASPSTTIADVKETLAEEINIPVVEQWLVDLDNDCKIVPDEFVVKMDMNLRLEGLVEITVNNLDGDGVLLSFEPGSDMKTVRSVISTQVGVSIKALRLSMDGKELGREYTPSKGDVISVEFPRVSVHLPDGSRKEIEISPRQSIEDLKKIVEKQENIAASAQQVFFFQGNDELQDNVTFNRSDFVDGTILEIRMQKPKVRIELHDGRSFDMEFEQSDTKNDVRYKIAREIGVPTQDLTLSMSGSPLDRRYKPSTGHVLNAEAPQIETKQSDGPMPISLDSTSESTKETIEAFTVNILCWSGDVVEVDNIETNSSLGELQERIHELKSVPVAKQNLSHGGHVINYPRSTSLRDCGIQHKDVIMLDNPDKKAVAKLPSPSLGSKTPFSFLQKASALLSGPKSDSDVSVAPLKEDENDDDDDSARHTSEKNYEESSDKEAESANEDDEGDDDEEEFEEDSAQHASEKDDEESSDKEAESANEFDDYEKEMEEDSTGCVSVKDDEALSDKEGEFTNEDKEVDEDEEEVGEETLEEEAITITIISPDLQAIELDLDPGTTIADVKETVAAEFGLVPSEMRLTKNGDSVSDDDASADGDVLTIEPATIMVILSDGSTLELAALPTTTVDDVKIYLEESTGVPKAQQVITFINNNSSALPDDLPLKNDTELKMMVITNTIIEESKTSDKDEADEIVSENDDWSSDEDEDLEETTKKDCFGTTEDALEIDKDAEAVTKKMRSSATSGALDVLRRAEQRTTSRGGTPGSTASASSESSISVNEASFLSMGSASSMNNASLSSLDDRIAKIKERTEARRRARANLDKGK